MTTRNFNWNFTTAHRMGESVVRESRQPDRPLVQRQRDRVGYRAQRQEEGQHLADAGLLPNSYS